MDKTENLEIALEALEYVMTYGRLPDRLPESLAENQTLQDLARRLAGHQEAALALADGDLSLDFPAEGLMGKTLKRLQRSLRDLETQAHCLASGEESPEGSLPGTFQTILDQFKQSVGLLEKRAQETQDTYEITQKLLQEAEAEFEKLQVQIDDVINLQAKLREQVIRDPLTGCFNRRYLDETLGREFSRAYREEYPISLIMVDVDHFKNLNDHYGHVAGDLYLERLGSFFREQCRAGDIVCRYGGEEFLIVMPNMKLTHAVDKAKNWRIDIEDFIVSFEGHSLQTTVSIGVASFPGYGSKPDLPLEIVDRALYCAKNGGRNTVQCVG